MQWTGGYPKTHDFLQPLERIGRSSAKEETAVEISTPVEKPPQAAAVAPSAEHILPGGIGTYSISHISYFAQRVVPKPEGSIFPVAQTSSTDRNDENSNCSSYTGSGFTLWEESAAVKKGKTGKENMGEKPVVRGKLDRVNCLYSIYFVHICFTKTYVACMMPSVLQIQTPKIEKDLFMKPSMMR